MFELSNPAAIEAYLRQNTALHLYELGDLDPFFWPRTRWFALPSADDGDIPDALCLLYDHPALPALIVMCEKPQQERIGQLCAAIAPVLPDNLYLHRSSGLPETLLPTFALTPRGEHVRMMLTSPELDDVSAEGVVALTSADAMRLEAFYADSYEGNWFDRRMLETGCYFAIEVEGDLASVAGVHVMSSSQRVAALGNIATAPAQRGRGLARRATAACCRHLMLLADDVGLNVRADNAAAIACYRRLGFSPVARYREAIATRGGRSID